jgi:hypothetical protein
MHVLYTILKARASSITQISQQKLGVTWLVFAKFQMSHNLGKFSETAMLHSETRH